MTAALAALALLSAAEAPDWFRAFQYTAASVSLRGCSECQGEPDDVCEVRAGAQTRPLAEYDQKRWPGPDRVKLLRSKADPDCAVPAASFHAARSRVELAAIRVARAPPGAAVLQRLGSKLAVAGWPRAPQRRKGEKLVAAEADRAGLRAALVCWSGEKAWPGTALEAGATCEWWLLPFRADGEPDLSARSFPLLPGRDRWPGSFRYGDARWKRAFDRETAIDDGLLLGEPAPASPAAAPAPPVASPTSPVAASAAPLIPSAATPAALSRCGDEARARPAVLDRFDQWEAQIAGGSRSLDRSRWALDLGAWSGHCQELEVLRAALEQQLGCSVAQEGRCLAPGGEAGR